MAASKVTLTGTERLGLRLQTPGAVKSKPLPAALPAQAVVLGFSDLRTEP